MDPDLASPFVDTGGVAGTAYFYRVEAINGCGVVSALESQTSVADLIDPFCIFADCFEDGTTSAWTVID